MKPIFFMVVLILYTTTITAQAIRHLAHPGFWTWKELTCKRIVVTNVSQLQFCVPNDVYITSIIRTGKYHHFYFWEQRDSVTNCKLKVRCDDLWAYPRLWLRIQGRKKDRWYKIINHTKTH